MMCAIVIDTRKRAKMGKQSGSGQHQTPIASTSASTSTALPQTDALAQSQSLFDENAITSSQSKKISPKLSPAELKALEDERQRKLTAAWEMCKSLRGGMEAGDDEVEGEWLIEAEKLVEHFRETRHLFVTAKVCLVLI